MPAKQPTKVSNVDNTSLRHEKDLEYGRAILFFSEKKNCWLAPGGYKIYAHETAERYVKKMHYAMVENGKRSR